jgi:hypothetical protein
MAPKAPSLVILGSTNSPLNRQQVPGFAYWVGAEVRKKIAASTFWRIGFHQDI